MTAELFGQLLDVLRSRDLLDRCQQLAATPDGGLTLTLWPRMPEQKEPTPEEALREYERIQFGAS